MSRIYSSQWRVDCSCLPAVAEARESQPWVRMHSEVTDSNLPLFIKEDKVGHHVTTRKLSRIYAEADGTVLVCNACGTIRVVE